MLLKMNAAPVKRLALLLCPLALAAAEPMAHVPPHKTIEVLPVAKGDYPAFPALLPLSDGRALITYKAGLGHTHDPGAPVATLTLNFRDDTISPGPILEPPAPLLYQCGEPVALGDGRIALFFDTQMIGPEPRHYRAPMRWVVSADEGRTFAAPQIFPVVAGTGYGYPQQGLTTPAGTYLMVMTFGYLKGGRWSMDIIHSSDHGASWNFVRNLSAELDAPGFNEGAFTPWGDGFLIVSRSYDKHARLHEVDASFQHRRTLDLTAASPWIASYLGRPRMLRHAGQLYLLGRNWTDANFAASQSSPANPMAFPPAQQLWLFRINPTTLMPEAGWILDNAEKAPLSDGYYAVGLTTGPIADERLQIITYKGFDGNRTELLRLEYRWNDFKK